VWQAVGSFFVLALLTTFVLLRVRQSPWLAVGWFWFIGSLVPVIGLVQVGAQSIADRYTYIPLVGIFVMVAWGGQELLNRWRVPPPALRALSVLVIAVLAGLTWRQLGFWKTHETIFRHSLSVTTDNCVAHSSLAYYLNHKGDSNEAFFHLQEALRLCPKDDMAWYNLGVWQRQRGNLPDAVSALREVLRLKPGYTKAWTNLGAVYLALGSIPEAADALIEAARLAPDDATVWFNLGVVHAKAGQFDEAVEAFRKAVLIMPDHAASWYRMGIAYLALGRQREALEAVQTLQAIDAKLAGDLLDQMSRGR
jgi:Flp pilus assembly protein TadD